MDGDERITVIDDLMRDVAILAAGAPAIIVVDLKAGLTMKFSPTSSLLCTAQSEVRQTNSTTTLGELL